MTVRRWAIMALFCGAAAASLALRWQPPKEDVQAAKVSETGEPGGLHVRGGVNTNEVEKGEILHWWLVFENRSQAALKDLRFVDVQIPGFVETGNCWVAHAPACRGDRSVAALAGPLDKGQSLTVTGDLTPAAGSGRYGLVAVYAWKGPGGAEVRNAITLAPIEVTTWWHRALINISQRVRSLITDLGLPVLLLFSGWWLQRSQKERDDQRKRVDDARAQRQTQETAILNTLLESNLKDTQKYYMPLVTALSTVIRTAPKAVGGSATDRRRLVYALIRFLRRQKFTVDEIGGFHLQSRSGEGVASLAWSVFFSHLEQHVPPEIRSRAFKFFEPALDLSAFNERLAAEAAAAGSTSPGALTAVETAVLAWVDHATDPLTASVPTLQIFHDVFFFEINRPFEYWYGKREKFPVEKLTAAKSQLPPEPIEEVKRLSELLNDYLKEGDAWDRGADRQTDPS